MSNNGSRAWARLRDEWGTRLEPGEQATVLVWSTFTVTFAGLGVRPDSLDPSRTWSIDGGAVGRRALPPLQPRHRIAGECGSRGRSAAPPATAPSRGRALLSGQRMR